ncbi:MAG TPA: TIGR03086 family metal-binding protein [Acidimicrobiales bacterium]|jgi:uncharacterized protein (TIGR03086 family)|nr:TIGR03086 family metal-binding protein [Acidimicrobiales bacterium]
MDVLPMMERVLDRAGEVVDGVKPDQLTNSTPCTEWSVRDVINHITGGATMFSVCVEQGSVPDDMLPKLMGGDNLGDDYKGSFHAASDRARAAFNAPGALDKTVKLPFGEMPAGVALNIAVMDVMTHAVDIAKATGQTINDEQLLETALAVGRQLISDDFRRPGVFDAEQPAPDGASASDRLLAFAGRQI